MCRNIHNVSETLKFKFYKSNISIPDTVKINIEGGCVFITGLLGMLTHKLNKFIVVQTNNYGDLEIYSNNHHISNKALIGTTRSLINGMIIGVTFGFIKKLQLVGIGYRVSMEDDVLHLTVGFSHVVYYKLPVGVKAQCLNQTDIVLQGINKQIVGQVAADLRSIKSPEPFKGKGVRYVDEIVRIKDSKKK